jgi:hypothetical protein
MPACSAASRSVIVENPPFRAGRTDGAPRPFEHFWEFFVMNDERPGPGEDRLEARSTTASAGPSRPCMDTPSVTWPDDPPGTRRCTWFVTARFARTARLDTEGRNRDCPTVV